MDESAREIIGDHDFDPQAADWKPLRLVIPEHDDLAWWMWMGATTARDTRERVHEYKPRAFRTYLRLDPHGRVYGWSPRRGVRLVGDGGATDLLGEMAAMFDRELEGVPHLIRLSHDEPPEQILARRELRLTDPDCPDCAREAGTEAGSDPRAAV